MNAERLRLALRWLSLCAFVAVSGCSDDADEIPYRRSSVIDTVVFDWQTHRRLAPGSDNWPVTWSMDGRILTSWGDGGGFGGTNREGRVSLGFAEVTGGRRDYEGRNVWGGVQSERAASFGGKTYGLLAVDEHLYAWVSPGSDEVNYQETRLVRSSDHGRSWSDTGVALSARDGLVLPAFLNAGPGYDGPLAEHVYSYFIELKADDRLRVQRPGEIALARAPRDRLEERTAYEWYAGPSVEGVPDWTDDIARRVPVFEDPNGVGWNVSVSYNAGLDRYFLLTEHGRTFEGNVGLFDAPTPWGPWSTILYEDGWGGEAGLQPTTFYWNFANPWAADDGSSVVLVFTGVRQNDSWNTVEARIVQARNDSTAL